MRVGAFAALCCVLLPGTSLATMADSFGLGSKAISMGGAFAAVADDYAALQYNPAGLALEKRNTLSLMSQYARPQVWIRNRDGRTQNVTLNKCSGIALGATSNWGQLFGYEELSGFSSGLFLYYPFSGLTQNRDSFPTERHFLMYEDRYEQMVILAGLAYRVFPSLSAGLGLNFSMDLDQGTYTTLSGFMVTSMTLSRDASMVMTPQGGILYMPTDAVSVALTYLGEIVNRVQGPYVLKGFQSGELDIYKYYRPPQVAVGTAVRPTAALTASVDLVWWNWSRFKDFWHDTPNPKFKDTVVPHLGIEYALAPRVALRGGYYFEKSPVPDQTGKSDYVDNDKHVVSAGAGWTTEPRESFPTKPISIEGHAQWHFLTERSHPRGHRSGGYVYNVGLTLAVHY